MKVILIQLNSKNDKQSNLSTVEALISEACEKHQPDLVALPEMFNFMGGSLDQKKSAAENFENGESIQLLKKLARKFNIYIHGGSLCEVDEGKYFNTTPIINPHGVIIAKYRKIHLFNFSANQTQYNEARLLSPGETIVTYQIANTKIACAICFDLRFSSLFSIFKDEDVKLIILPSAFTYETGKAHWEILLRARAIETQSFVIAPAQTGTYIQDSQTLATWGHSMILDPWGNKLSTLDEEIGYQFQSLNFDFLEAARKKLPLECDCHTHRVTAF